MGRWGLTNNQLKLIAMTVMTCDHVGLMLFPEVTVLRLIGRLAFPIYAFMIADGCCHTRNMPRHLYRLGGLAAACQVVYYLVEGSLAQSILVTFTLSVGLILLIKRAREEKTWTNWLQLAAGVLFVLLITEGLTGFVGKGFSVDYGFIGVMLPVLVYVADTKTTRLAVTAGCLALLSATAWPGQWCSLLALPLLALYNGQRGRLRIKWLFYFYYPAHLAVIGLLAIYC